MGEPFDMERAVEQADHFREIAEDERLMPSIVWRPQAHADICDFHHDNYPDECTCGLLVQARQSARQAAPGGSLEPAKHIGKEPTGA